MDPILTDVDDGQRLGRQRLVDRPRRDPGAPGQFQPPPFTQRCCQNLRGLRGGFTERRCAERPTHVGFDRRHRDVDGICFRVRHDGVDHPRSTLACDSHTHGQLQSMAALAFR